jgi:hypothetical protein
MNFQLAGMYSLTMCLGEDQNAFEEHVTNDIPCILTAAP